MTQHNGEHKSLVPSVAAVWERRRLVLSLVLCLIVALVAAVALRTYGPWIALGSTLYASPTASPTPALHETYYVNVEIIPLGGPVPVVQVDHQVSLRRTPSLKGYAPASLGPALIHCTLALYGPYPSLADLTKALNVAAAAGDGIAPPGPPAFTAPPLTMSDWDSVTHQVEIALPTTLQAGYYQTDSECLYDRDQSSGGTGSPIQIDI